MINEKNLGLLKSSLPYIRVNIRPKKITGVTAKRLENDILGLWIEFLN